jgi:hypothetical protein
MSPGVLLALRQIAKPRADRSYGRRRISEFAGSARLTAKPEAPPIHQPERTFGRELYLSGSICRK